MPDKLKVTFDPGGYSSYQIGSGNTIITDTQDYCVYQSPGTARVRIFLPHISYVSRCTFDVKLRRYAGSYAIRFFNQSGTDIGGLSVMPYGVGQNTWETRSHTVSMLNVASVRFDLFAPGSPIGAPGQAYIDNCEIEFEPQDVALTPPNHEEDHA